MQLTQADIKPLILVPQSPECWDSRHTPMHPASLFLRSLEGDSNTWSSLRATGIDFVIICLWCPSDPTLNLGSVLP